MHIINSVRILDGGGGGVYRRTVTLRCDLKYTVRQYYSAFERTACDFFIIKFLTRLQVARIKLLTEEIIQ